jgi:hypothetical protein
MDLVRVGRSYLAVLGVAVVALAAALIADVGGSASNKPLTAHQMMALELGALQRVKFPSSFVSTRQGCMTGRCYVVAAPSSRLATLMPGIMRAHRVQPPGALRSAEPITALRKAHWSTASADPYVVACKTGYTPSHAAMTSCQDGYRVGQTLVNVLVSPYQPCANHACSDPSKSLVSEWSVTLPTTS